MAGGQAGCTLLDCVVPDAGPVARQCGSNADSSANEVREYAMGCATARGRCVSNGCLSLPVASQYGGCDRATIQRGSACLPDRPWRAMGAYPDAG